MSGRILVIRLGSLGDFIQALGPMQAIRRHHPDAEITLLTTPPFKALGEASGYFDRVVLDTRPRWHDIGGWLGLRRMLNAGRFDRVYDLQNSDRTSIYLRLFDPRPEWSGAARGASHRNAAPSRTAGSPFEGHRQTLALAGIDDVVVDRLDWIAGDCRTFGLEPGRYVLLVPGSSPHLLHKRWPAAHYGEVARYVGARGYIPVVVGTAAEAEAARVIVAAWPATRDLTGRTALTDLAVLGRSAAAAIGNDTGPLHMIAPTGCRTIALFSDHSDPKKYAPLGANVTTLQRDRLEELSPATVIEALGPLD